MSIRLLIAASLLSNVPTSPATAAPGSAACSLLSQYTQSRLAGGGRWIVVSGNESAGSNRITVQSLRAHRWADEAGNPIGETPSLSVAKALAAQDQSPDALKVCGGLAAYLEKSNVPHGDDALHATIRPSTINDAPTVLALKMPTISEKGDEALMVVSASTAFYGGGGTTVVRLVRNPSGKWMVRGILLLAMA
jgi:hypothetical protein